jgi:hypothetical protein
VDAQNVVVEAFRLTERLGDPSVGKAREIARLCGAKFTNGQASAWLKPFTERVQRSDVQKRRMANLRGPKNEHESDRQVDLSLVDAADRQRTGTGPTAVPLIGPTPEHETDRRLGAATDGERTASCARGNGIPNQSVTPSTPSLLTSSSRDGAAAVAAGSTASEELEWVTTLRADTNAIKELELRQLTPEQLVTLGRYHAWRFAYCTRSESSNRSKGQSIATAFAKMALSKQFADLKVFQYVDLGARLHELRGKTPWYEPFDIIVVDREPDPIPCSTSNVEFGRTGNRFADALLARARA